MARNESLASKFQIVKDGEPDRYWVMCKHPKCYWLHEVSSEKVGRIKAYAHLALHNTHKIELHSVKTEVIRYGTKEAKL